MTRAGTAVLAAAALVAIVAVLASLFGSGIDRGGYVAANEAVLAELPTYPGARVESTSSAPAYTDENTLAGYTTLRLYELPRESTPAAVASYYERALVSGGWTVVERLDGPVLSFRRGNALVSVNLEGWRGGILEVVVDHAAG